MSILSLVAKHVVNLVPYASARRLFKASEQGAAKPVWLNANEAPTGKQYSLDTTLYNRYPDCQPDAVIAGYANYTGLNKEQVLVSRGADEGIELLIRGFCEAGKDNILICPPTYGMYAISARTFDIGVIEIPLINDFQLTSTRSLHSLIMSKWFLSVHRTIQRVHCLLLLTLRQ